MHAGATRAQTYVSAEQNAIIWRVTPRPGLYVTLGRLNDIVRRCVEVDPAGAGLRGRRLRNGYGLALSRALSLGGP